jgi:hypothetical protein
MTVRDGMHRQTIRSTCWHDSFLMASHTVNSWPLEFGGGAEVGVYGTKRLTAATRLI